MICRAAPADCGGKMQFPATIRASGKNTTGIPVPADVVEALGAGKRPKVTVTLNGYTYRSSIASMHGEFMISVSAEVREHAGVSAGDDVVVEVEVDTEPREVTLPPDVVEALNVDRQLAARFEGLSYSNKRRILLSIEGAKTPETRSRRITRAIDELRDK
jgi:hypothetical protein